MPTYTLRAAIAAALLLPTGASAADFIVTNTNDAGAGSFDDAFSSAQTTCAAGPHRILFDIPGAGPHTIGATDAVFLTCNGLVIDGTSQTANQGDGDPSILGAGHAVGSLGAVTSGTEAPEIIFERTFAMGANIEATLRGVRVNGSVVTWTWNGSHMIVEDVDLRGGSAGVGSFTLLRVHQIHAAPTNRNCNTWSTGFVNVEDSYLDCQAGGGIYDSFHFVTGLTANLSRSKFISSNAEFGFEIATNVRFSADQITTTGVGARVSNNAQASFTNSHFGPATKNGVERQSGTLIVKQSTFDDHTGRAIAYTSTATPSPNATNCAVVIDSAQLYMGSLLFEGTACANSAVDLFAANDGAGDFGHGEGPVYLGSVTTDGAGNFSTTLAPQGLGLGDFVTGYATNLTGTSEFGANVPITEILFDYGDAPLSYGSVSHAIVPGYSLGLTVTPDATDYDSPDASADVDDGMARPGFTLGTRTIALVNTQSDAVLPGVLSAWVDWNGDGDFDDADEQITANTLADASGNIVLSISPPDDAVTGETFMRLRFTTELDIGSRGVARDGEVEDYLVYVRPGIDSVRPFDDCPTDLFLIESTPSDVYAIDPLTYASAPLVTGLGGFPITGGGLNAAGFNTLDGRIYARSTNSPNGGNVELMIYAIGADGSYTAFGPTIPGMPSPQAGNVGDVDGDGYLHVTGAGANNAVAVVDVTPGRSTFMTVVRTYARVADPAVTGALGVDMAFNHNDGLFYSLRSGTDPVLVTMDPNTGEVNTVGNVAGINGSSGSQYLYDDDQLVVVINDTGLIYRIDLTDPTLTATLVGDTGLPNQTNNDGASCATRPFFATPDVPTVDFSFSPDGLPVITGTYDAVVGTIELTVAVDGVFYDLSTSPELTSDPATGTWRLDLTGLATPLADGVYDVAVRSTAPSPSNVGDLSVADLTVDELTIDVPPNPLLISVASGTYYTTQPMITGTYDPAQLGSLVLSIPNDSGGFDEIIIGSDAGTTLNPDGTWSWDASALPYDLPIGATTVTLTQVDDQGNPAEATAEITIILFNVPTVTPIITNNASPTLGGTFDADLLDTSATATVTVNGVTATTGFTLNPDGTWSWDLTAQGVTLPEGTHDVSISFAIIDDSGVTNTWTDATTNEVTIDLTAPTAPTVNNLLTGNPNPTVTGTYDGDDTSVLTVTIDGVTYTLGSDPGLSVDPSAGTWALDLTDSPSLADGPHPVIVTTTDEAGNTSQGNGDVTVDASIPIDPTVDTLVTNSTEPTLTGTYDVPSADTLVIEVGGYTFTDEDDALTLDPSTGTWQLDLTGSPLAEGVYDVVVTQTNTVGVVANDTTADELTIDLTPPGAPTVDPLVSPDGRPVLTGTYDPSDYAALTVSVNGETYGVDDDELTIDPDNGVWQLDLSGAPTPLAEGLYDVIVAQTDEAGNMAFDVTIDELDVSYPVPGTPTVNPLLSADGLPVLTGTYDPDLTVSITVTVDGVTYDTDGGALTLDPEAGTWQLDLSDAPTPLADGTYDVVVTVIDPAEQTITDTTDDELVVDTTPPAIPTVDLVTSDDGLPVLTGTYDPNDTGTITVTVNDVTYTVDTGLVLDPTTGAWELDLTGLDTPLPEGTYDIVVTHTDDAGNTSTDSTDDELVVEYPEPIDTADTGLPEDTGLPIDTDDIDDAGAYYVGGGCEGCATSTPSPLGWLLLTPMAVLLRRRR